MTFSIGTSEQMDGRGLVYGCAKNFNYEIVKFRGRECAQEGAHVSHDREIYEGAVSVDA